MGVRTTNLDPASLADDVIVNRDGNTQRLPVASLATQLAGTGAVADALSAQGARVTELESGGGTQDDRLEALETTSAAHGSRVTLLETTTAGHGTRLNTLEDATAFATVLTATWTDLAAVTGAGAGQAGEVLDSDTGTHTDPVASGTVPNAGRYSWSVSPAGWERIGDTGLSGRAPMESAIVPCAVSGTANSITLTPEAGYTHGTSAERLFSFEATASNTGAMTLQIPSFAASDLRQIRLPNNHQVPAGTIREGASVVVRYKLTGPLAGQYELIAPQPIYSSDIPLTQTNVSANYFITVASIPGMTPASGRSTFSVVAAADRGTGELLGVLLSIDGAEVKNVLHPDGTAVEPGTYVTGDTLVFGALDTGLNAYPLLSPGKPSAAAASSGGSQRLAEIRFSTILEGLS